MLNFCHQKHLDFFFKIKIKNFKIISTPFAQRNLYKIKHAWKLNYNVSDFVTKVGKQRQAFAFFLYMKARAALAYFRLFFAWILSLIFVAVHTRIYLTQNSDAKKQYNMRFLCHYEWLLISFSLSCLNKENFLSCVPKISKQM